MKDYKFIPLGETVIAELHKPAAFITSEGSIDIYKITAAKNEQLVGKLVIFDPMHKPQMLRVDVYIGYETAIRAILEPLN